MSTTMHDEEPNDVNSFEKTKPKNVSAYLGTDDGDRHTFRSAGLPS